MAEKKYDRVVQFMRLVRQRGSIKDRLEAPFCLLLLMDKLTDKVRRESP